MRMRAPTLKGGKELSICRPEGRTRHARLAVTQPRHPRRMDPAVEMPRDQRKA